MTMMLPIPGLVDLLLLRLHMESTMIPPQPDWDESSRSPAFCRECECITNHTTKEHQEAEAMRFGNEDEDGEA